MRCRTARKWILERQLGRRAGVHETALGAHVRTCPDCASDARAGEALARQLAALRADIPFPLDVADLVMLRIGALGTVKRSDRSGHQLAGIAAATLLVALGILGTVAWHAPALLNGLQVAGGVLFELAAASLRFLRPAGDLLGALGELIAHAGSALLAVLSPLGRLAPSFHGMAFATLLIMTATTAFLVGRDLRAEKEP